MPQVRFPAAAAVVMALALAPAAFPDTSLLVQTHQDLARSAQMNEALRQIERPARVDAEPQSADLQVLAGQIERVRSLRAEIGRAGERCGCSRPLPRGLTSASCGATTFELRLPASSRADNS